MGWYGEPLLVSGQVLNQESMEELITKLMAGLLCWTVVGESGGHSKLTGYLEDVHTFHKWLSCCGEHWLMLPREQLQIKMCQCL